VSESTTALDNPRKVLASSNSNSQQRQNDQSRELQQASSYATLLPTLPSLLNMSTEASTIANPLSHRAKSHWRAGQAALAVANALGTPDKVAAKDVATDDDAHAWSDQVSADSGSPKTRKKRRRKKAALKSGEHQCPLASHKQPCLHVTFEASAQNLMFEADVIRRWHA
jgi:hypothetical protein